MVKLVEQTKICANSACALAGQRQPWSSFYAKVKWDDGTMRQPQSRCKVCHRESVRVNRTPAMLRRYDRKKYRRLRKDPIAWAKRLEDQRFQYRARHGVAHISRARPASLPLDGAPLATWLREVMDRDETSITATAERLGMADKTMRRILHGSDVELATVERALIADDTITLRELYSSLYAEAA